MFENIIYLEKRLFAKSLEFKISNPVSVWVYININSFGKIVLFFSNFQERGQALILISWYQKCPS